jgi:hypothetical protein
MQVIIDGRIYKAATAVALIDEIKEMNWAASPDTSAEEYISIQKDTYRRVIDREMELPAGDTEARATAMFEAIDVIGAWKFEKEE